ncbi:AraC family transcriptional regulator [bacterium]|nr:MAG: AraC family transcriptional regulator [bacterium]
MRQLRVDETFPIPHLPLSVFRVANYDHGRHSHEFLELVLVTGGRAQHLHFAPESDVPLRYSVATNDLFLVPLGWSHAYEGTQDFSIYNILFMPSLLSGGDGMMPEEGARPLELFSGSQANSNDDLTRKIRLRAGERELIENCLREVSRELTTRRTGYEWMVRAKVVETLILVARIAAARSSGNVSMTLLETGSPVEAAAAYMEEHFREPLALEEIARAAHLNPNYLCELFKSTLGISVGAYLSQLRLEHARFLLSVTQLSITEVGRQAGFADSSYFARVFKTTTGLSPREFRAGLSG